jgi:hypothetical protein
MATKKMSKGKGMKPGAKFQDGAYGPMMQNPLTIKGAGKGKGRSKKGK